MSSDKSSTCENSTGIIVHIVTAHTVALSPTRGRTTADCFRWELWAHDSRNISVRSSRHAQILSVMIYTCPIPDFIFPKSRVINVLKHYTRSFNTSDYLAQNHYGSVFSFFADGIVSLRAAYISLISFFCSCPVPENPAVSFKRGYEKLNRSKFLTYDVSCTCALSSLECYVLNMGTIQIRKHMGL